MPNNRRERERYLDEDGECRMCQAGEWPRDAETCPVCDAELPGEEAPTPGQRDGVGD